MEKTTNKKTKDSIYLFGLNVKNPPPDKKLLGGKGAALAEMAALGFPVPEGFIVSTDCCHAYQKKESEFLKEFDESLLEQLKALESQTSKTFGGKNDPLLLSVRSGAPISMPGMMDTILNIGLNDETVLSFAKANQNERLAFDCYQRLIMMYGETVKGIDKKLFEEALLKLKKEDQKKGEELLSLDALKRSCTLFKEIYKNETGTDFPQNVNEQLFSAVRAVFESFDSERAKLYRQLHKIADSIGTAVTVQKMVFGNKNEKSLTGVAFTRNPATGSNEFYGEFLINAQGEEVVSGSRTPQAINLNQKKISGSTLPSLEELMPQNYEELKQMAKKLELHFKEMQDLEFTVDDGKLYLLQTRTGKRTGFAALRILIEMLEEGLIDEKTALKRIHPDQIVQLLTPVFDEKAKIENKKFNVARGLNAGPGAATGLAALSKEKAIEYKEKGIDCILVREETSPDDFPGMVAACGILTSRGGSTSHAAVVARGIGKPCIVGCHSLLIDQEKKIIKVKNQTIKEGESLSIDGTTGELFFCELKTTPSEILQVLLYKTKNEKESLLYRQYVKLMALADRYRKLKVRTNADTKEDCEKAKAFGAEGIGLCRTEHMFMDPKRLNDVRCLFFSRDEKERQKAVKKLLPHQKDDFIEIFTAMKGHPVTIRLLDPPLHEFMPHTDTEMEAVAKVMKMDVELLYEIKKGLEEQNPMLGFRGCRLGIIYPELTAMQTRAILEAACEVAKKGIKIEPEIMIPLVGIKKELEHQKMIIDQTAELVFKEEGIKKEGVRIEYKVGTMIELPRSALIADELAQVAQFFSFGTNDLTETTFGLSRDDSGKFIPLYIQGVPNPLNEKEKMEILKDDPFQVIDQEGVGKLMEIAIEKGQKTNPQIKLGICGEHGGDASSVMFCHKLGLDYVSCSPFRIAVAKLAAAQANI